MVENAEELKPQLAHLNTRDNVVFKIPGRSAAHAGGPAICGSSPSTNGRNCGTCCAATCRWWARARPCRAKWTNTSAGSGGACACGPGLTCLWAISGRDKVDFETWMKMDMQYIDNWSLSLDWKILLQTIPRVLTGHGAN